MLAVKKKENRRIRPEELEQGRNALEAQDYKLAETVYRKIIAADDQHIEGLMGLAKAHHARNYLVEAEVILEYLLEFEPEFEEAEDLLESILDDFSSRGIDLEQAKLASRSPMESYQAQSISFNKDNDSSFYKKPVFKPNKTVIVPKEAIPLPKSNPQAAQQAKQQASMVSLDTPILAKPSYQPPIQPNNSPTYEAAKQSYQPPIQPPAPNPVMNNPAPINERQSIMPSFVLPPDDVIVATSLSFTPSIDSPNATASSSPISPSPPPPALEIPPLIMAVQPQILSGITLGAIPTQQPIEPVKPMITPPAPAPLAAPAPAPAPVMPPTVAPQATPAPVAYDPNMDDVRVITKRTPSAQGQLVDSNPYNPHDMPDEISWHVENTMFTTQKAKPSPPVTQTPVNPPPITQQNNFKASPNINPAPIANNPAKFEAIDFNQDIIPRGRFDKTVESPAAPNNAPNMSKPSPAKNETPWQSDQPTHRKLSDEF